MATLIRDTFTDANDTLLGSHIGETNATWASNTGFGSGNGNADEFIIKSNQLRRVDFTDMVGFSGGTALAYSSTSPSLDALPHFDITFDLTFETGVTNSETALYYAAEGVSATLIATIGNTLISISGGGSYAFSPAADQAYAVKLLRRGDIVALFVDDVMIEALPGVSMTGKFGISMFDVSATTLMHIDNLLVESVEGVAYYDEFSGTGTLNGYASDSGASYLAVSGALTSMIRGSGFLRPDSTASTRVVLADVEMPEGSPTIEMFAQRAAGGAGLWIISMRLQSQASADLFGMSLRFLSGVTELWLYDGTTTVIQDVNELLGTPSPLTGVVCHVTTSFDAGTSELVVTLNGPEVYRQPVATVDTETWRPTIEMRTDSTTTGVRLYRVMASAETPPVTPAFWTNLIKTQEVI